MPAHPSPPDSKAAPSRRATLRALGAGESGFSLIEVMISAMLVAVIAIGTLTGFEAAGNTASDNRVHDQAALLASESQEELRTDPAPTLADLVAEEHSYTRTVENRKFTVVQQATLLKNKGDAECGSGSSADDEPSENYEVRSSVTWAATAPEKPKPVEDASVITPPEGASLDVEVNNGGSPAIPVVGATVKTVPTANASSKTDELAASSSSAGCAFFTSLTSDLVNIAVSKPGYITTTGASVWEANDVVLAPNVITRKQAPFGEAGMIEALFTNAVHTGAKSDTFVAYNSEYLGNSSKVLLGGKKGEYLSKAATKSEAYPFSKRWTVYAGDCTADKPPSGIKESSALVPSEPRANVPMSYVTLKVYEGTSSNAKHLTSLPLPVSITNTGCGTTSAYESKQALNGEGALSYPFQPFGSYTLCVYAAKKTYTTAAYTNSTEAGTELPFIYLEGTTTGKNAGTNVTVAEKVESEPSNC
jgi:Tfp pilus assembly protein PilV